MTQHRISCGALVLRDRKILLVHHLRAGQHDFWVAPGGGVEGEEDLVAAAERETFEETGIRVRAHTLAYIDELFVAGYRTVKFWYLADYVSGRIDVSANPAAGEAIIAAGWFAQDALPTGLIFPQPLRDAFWRQWESGFPAPVKLPLRGRQS